MFYDFVDIYCVVYFPAINSRVTDYYFPVTLIEAFQGIRLILHYSGKGDYL